jgi:hypothetical protein
MYVAMQFIGENSHDVAELLGAVKYWVDEKSNLIVDTDRLTDIVIPMNHWTLIETNERIGVYDDTEFWSIYCLDC